MAKFIKVKVINDYHHDDNMKIIIDYNTILINISHIIFIRKNLNGENKCDICIDFINDNNIICTPESYESLTKRLIIGSDTDPIE